MDSPYSNGGRRQRGYSGVARGLMGHESPRAFSPELRPRVEYTILVT